MKNWCEHIYPSNCHGIDMIKINGKEFSVGGTNAEGRFNFCPICGKERPKEEEKIELLDVLRENIGSVNAHVLIKTTMDWIKERLPEEKPNNHKDFIVEYYSNGYNTCLSEVKKALGVE